MKNPCKLIQGTLKRDMGRAMALLCLFSFLPFLGFGQYTIVDDEFYSDALGADELVDVWLPPGYDDNPGTYYPVIYLLHKAFSNQDAYEEFLPVLNQMTEDGEIDPFIVVKPNGWAPPYLGSCWYNSALYGNYEDMVRVDLINYIEANYRALIGQDHRYHMGHSMGGHAGWSMSIRFPDLFAAVADIAGYKNMGMTTQLLLPAFLGESGGAPPYAYSPANGQLSALVYTVLGAYNANMSNPPYYVNMFLDDNGDIIPEYYEDWLSDDIMLMIPGAVQPPETKYWIGQGYTDNVVPYPTIIEFLGVLDQYCWDYTFFEYDGGHFDFAVPMEEAFRFIDGVWKSKNETSMDYSILVEDIEFQPGVTIDINVNVYVHEAANNWPDHGKIIGVEGMAHTGSCWQPFAEALFEGGPQSAHLNEFYAIDMPGRGGSGLPEAESGVFLLEQMYIEDYLEVIKGVIRYLNDDMGVHPKTIMGHSLGGLEVILLQDALVEEGSNMRQEFGIKNAILLAPGIPAPLDWSFITPGPNGEPPPSLALFSFVNYFVPGLGTILNIPCNEWPYMFFTNTCCYTKPEMVPGAPTPGEVNLYGYAGIEPAPLLLQISGTPIPPGLPYPHKPRVTAERGIFKPQQGVQLTIIADQYDKMMHPDEEAVLYEYLTNDENLDRFLVVMGEETCHDTHISDPHAVASLLNMPYFFKYSEAPETDIQEYAENLYVYPNPVKDQLHVQYTLKEESSVHLDIFDSRGAICTTYENPSQSAGEYRLTLNIESLPAGIYFCRLITNTAELKVKLVKQ